MKAVVLIKGNSKRTLEDGSKQYFSDMLLKNELNVLLTRGVNGLYIYAVDDQLKEALKKPQRVKIMDETKEILKEINQFRDARNGDNSIMRKIYHYLLA